MANWIKRVSYALAGFTVGASLTGCATTDRDGQDWSLAHTHFLAGEERSPMVFTRKDASRCVGRWRLHADAVDDGAFPLSAHDAFPYDLRLNGAIGAAEFFKMDVSVPALIREASDEAEQRLRSALNGDRQAFRQYFEALGECSTKPETVRDTGRNTGGDAADEAAEGPAG